LTETPWLDGKHVVFGEVLEGFDHLKTIESLGNLDGQPKKSVVVAFSGELN